MSAPAAVARAHGRFDRIHRDTGTGTEHVHWDITKSRRAFDQPLVLNVGQRCSGKSTINRAIVNELVMDVASLIWCGPSDTSPGSCPSVEFVSQLYRVAPGIEYVHLNDIPDTDGLLASQRARIESDSANSLMLLVLDEVVTSRVWRTESFKRFLQSAGRYNIYVVISHQYLLDIPGHILLGVANRKTISIQSIASGGVKKYALTYILREWQQQCHDQGVSCDRLLDNLTENYMHVVVVDGGVLWCRARPDEHRYLDEARQSEQHIRDMADQYFPLERYKQELEGVLIPDLAAIALGYVARDEAFRTAARVCRDGIDDDPLAVQIAADAFAVAGSDWRWPLAVCPCGRSELGAAAEREDESNGPSSA